MENEYNFLLLVGRKEILIWAEYYYIYIYIYKYTHIYNILNFFTLLHRIWKAEKWSFAWKILHLTIFLPFLLQPNEGKGMSQFKSNQILFTESKENRGKFKQGQQMIYRQN